MALYLGNSNKLKLVLNGSAYSMKAFPKTTTTDYIKLLSSDSYVLKDSNGVYLTTKEDK